MLKKPVLAILLLALVALAYFYYRAYLSNGASSSLTLYGNVDIREVQMAFRVGGRISGMNFEEGDQVAVGDLLAQLDAEPQEQALAIAIAGVAEAQARLSLLERGARPQEIEQARAAVNEARAGLDNAEQEYLRQKELVAQDLSSQRALDQTLSARDQWEARLAQAQESLELAEEGFRIEEIEQAKAAVQAAIARRDQAETQLADTRLSAVSSGTVMTRVIEPGAMVMAGSPVYTISLTDRVYVRAYVDETHLGEVVPGSRVKLTIDSGIRVYEGQVGFVSPRAEFTPKSVETPALRTDLVYRLRIVVTDADEHLRQGMPVTITVLE